MLKSNQSSKRNHGSAARLKGRCCIFNVFVKDPVSCWSPDEKDGALQNLALAAGFIESHAKRYGIDLEIIQGYALDRNDAEYPGIIPVDLFADYWWTEELFHLVGYSGGNRAVERIKKEYRAGQVAVLYHVNKPGTSYNLSYSIGIDPVLYAERAVMFYSYEDGMPTCAASYAHEILHCFGAGELYFPFDDTDERLKLAREYFPDDVMLRVDYEINTLSIGEYTAYRVGWLGKLDKRFRIFEDEG